MVPRVEENEVLLHPLGAYIGGEKGHESQSGIMGWWEYTFKVTLKIWSFIVCIGLTHLYSSLHLLNYLVGRPHN